MSSTTPAQVDENPHTTANTTDDERADMLAEYLDHVEGATGERPKLMPLDAEGKGPIITGKCSLDSEQSREYLTDGDEAVRQIREEGVRGFAIYAGKPEHNTEEIVLVDVDDRETFPYGEFPATLTVLSGSARGEHFTYLNGGDVDNASGKDGVDGEVRAKNWFCVTPGSIHPSGGVYHIHEERGIVTLNSEQIPDALLPNSKRHNSGSDGDGDGDAADPENYEPDPSAAVTDVTESNTWIVEYLAGFKDDPDRSRLDHAVCRTFISNGVPEDEARDVMKNSPASKVGASDASASYWSDTWASALTAEQNESDDDEDGDRDASTAVEAVASGDPGTFTSPTLEAVEGEDGTVTAIGTTEDGSEVRALQLGTFECVVCETIINTAVTEKGIHEPEGCPECERSGPFRHLGFDGDTDAGILPELHALLDPPWYTPSEVDGTRINEMWGDIRDHWDAGEESEYLYDGLTAYAITTWLRPDLDFLPHMMLMGRFTGGKTRLLNTLARVSYRAVVSASATPSSMFRLIDAKDVTFFVSEYHGLDPDTRRELDAIVRAAQKRGEVVTRSEANPDAGGYDVGVYDPFTHVAIATQYEPADDIISRCVQVHTTRNTRSMPATLDEDRATDIRNRLLGIRLRYLSSDEFEDAERAAYGYLAQRDIEGRPREKLLAIVTVAEMFDKLDAIEPFVDKLVELTEQAESNSEDALFIEAVRDVAFREVGNTVHAESEDPFANIEGPLKDVTERYNDVTGQERSPSWTGQLRARHGFDSKRKSDGTVIADENLGHKLKRLCESYDLGFESLEAHSPITEMAQQDQHRGKCSKCGHNEWLDYKDTDAGHYMCSRCASELRDAA